MRSQLYDLLRRCTVRVQGKSGHGTGFFVAPGLILTCAHVVTDAVLDIHWSGLSYSSQIQEFLPDVDLALLKVDLIGHPFVPLDGAVEIGDRMSGYGYPDNYPHGDTITCEYEGWTEDEYPLLKFKIGQVRPGMSGMPLLNMRTGYVCGMVRRTRDRDSDLGCRAIPVGTILLRFPQLESLQHALNQQDHYWLACLDRMKYLRWVNARHDYITLPFGPSEGISLQAVFQPLVLRSDPLASEDRERYQRRPFLGERVSHQREDDEGEVDGGGREGTSNRPVIAKNGEDALKKSMRGRIVVLGGPGTGKTTLLRYLVGKYAQLAQADLAAPLPIFVMLPDLANKGISLREYLQYLSKEIGMAEDSVDILVQAIADGNAFVCLDSLDEVSPSQRPDIIRSINELASDSGNTWVVGSRFTEYKGGQFTRSQFAEWELLPLDHDLREQLAQRLIAGLRRRPLYQEEENIAEALVFVKLLENHSQAAVYVKKFMLPSSRVTLYQMIINAVLETRERDAIRRGMLLRTVATLALGLYQTKGRTFTRDDMLELLPTIRQQQNENWLTEDMVTRIIGSGVLEVVAQETYGFRHQTFQEYLAAVELARLLVSRDQTIQESLAWRKRTFSRWTEILRLMVGVLAQKYGKKGLEAAQRWLRELLEQRETEEGDPGSLGMALALSSLSELAEARVEDWDAVGGMELEREILAIWIAELVDSIRFKREARQKRLQALAKEITTLRTSALQTLVDQLKAFLDHTEDEIREAMVQVLGAIGERASVEPLTKALHDRSYRVCSAAIRSLWMRKDQVSINTLLDFLDSPHVFQFDKDIIKTLAEHTPVHILLRALHSSDIVTRNDAILAIEKLGEHAPLASLVEILSHDFPARAGVLRSYPAAARALGALGKKYSSITNQLLSILHDPESGARMRWAILQALELSEQQIPLEALVAALRDKESYVRTAAALALSRQNERIPVEPLMEALQDEDSEVRAAAARALSRLGARIPVEPLVEALQDEDSEVRVAAVWALSELGERMPVDLLIEALQDKDRHVRHAAVGALGTLGELMPVEPLIAALFDNYKRVRLDALEALGERVPIELLPRLLQVEVDSVRQTTVRLLGWLGERAPFELLAEALHHRMWYIRNEAMQVVQELLDRGCVPFKSLVLNGRRHLDVFLSSES